MAMNGKPMKKVETSMAGVMRFFTRRSGNTGSLGHGVASQTMNETPATTATTTMEMKAALSQANRVPADSKAKMMSTEETSKRKTPTMSTLRRFLNATLDLKWVSKVESGDFLAEFGRRRARRVKATMPTGPLVACQLSLCKMTTWAWAFVLEKKDPAPTAFMVADEATQDRTQDTR